MARAGPGAVAERFYDGLIENDDTRLCEGIPDAACRVVPGNFFTIMVSLVLTNLGDLLSSPKVVLAWLMGTVGAPAAAVAMLVPVREAGSLLPQMLLGAWIRRHARRRGFWIAGSLVQAGCVLGMAAAAWWLDGVAAGASVLVLLGVFALGRATASVAMKDVQGKTVPRRRRGRLTGLASGSAGVAVLVLSVLLFGEGSEPERGFYAGLLLAASCAWLLAAILFTRVAEEPGETDGGRELATELGRGARLLVEDVPFRRFVLTRGLLMGSAIAAPFLVVVAQRGAATAGLLAAFLLAASLASSLSAVVWGWMADASSRRVMLRAGASAALVCIGTAGASWWLGKTPAMGALSVVAYFVLSVAHEGVRIGRKTYLVDMAEGNKRTDYVAVSNTVIGAALLVTGALGGALATLSPEVALLALGLMGLVGTIAAARLPDL